MDLLIRPSPFNLAQDLVEIDNLLSGTGIAFALFLSNDRMILANASFLKKWDLHRISFPMFSLADFRNKNARNMSGETKGRFWSWSGETGPNPSIITLPDPATDLCRLLLRVPTKKDSAADPFFLEKWTQKKVHEEEKDGLMLLAGRLRKPARAVVRAFMDEILLKKFCMEEIARGSGSDKAEILLVQDPRWTSGSPVLRIRKSETPGDRLIVENALQNESETLIPFRRMRYSKVPGKGFWIDFPLIVDGSFFGKIRLFRTESEKLQLASLKRFERSAQSLAKNLFQTRKDSGGLALLEREPETGFLSRKGTLNLLELLIEECRLSGERFGLVGVKIDLPNHRDLMIKLRGTLRHCDEIGHLTVREYLLVLPAMNPSDFQPLIERTRDMLLGMYQDQEHLVSFGTLSYPESRKGPMNLIRSAFMREETQQIQKAPVH